MVEQNFVPEGIDADHRAALHANFARLERASAAQDTEQLVGTAKDLTECVCKVILECRGCTYGSAESLPKLAKKAMSELGAHPATHQGRPPLQRLTGALVQIPQTLAELRNRDGTGHGRASITELSTENAELVRAIGVAWSRWSLAALGRALADVQRVSEAVRRIQSEVFHRRRDDRTSAGVGG